MRDKPGPGAGPVDLPIVEYEELVTGPQALWIDWTPLLRLEGGRVATRQESGRPPGTAVTVEDLFFNVPARLKFLRTDRTERRHIDGWLTRYAMAYPGLRFTLSHDERIVLDVSLSCHSLP